VPGFNLTVGIATRGRPAILREMLATLAQQTRRADHVVICGGDPADVDDIAERFPEVTVILSPPGLCQQRNAIIAAATNADVLLFFDDDFLAERDYLAGVEDHMSRHPATVVATGVVLADGIGGPGLSPSEGHTILANPIAAGSGTRPVFSAYGCNMSLRLKTMRDRDLWFDERLQLYCWQEDVDMSRRLAAFGDIVLIEKARGVHLGVKSGRSAGVKLGYSQVANPLYLASKQSGYPMAVALTLIMRNIAKNLARALWSETYVDRRGRLRGNVIALMDLIRGHMTPERVRDV
jgi:GT2 family glycosyltransferase